MCRVCVSNIAEKREEVCVECSRASCPYETKGDFFFFAFLEGPCEASKRYTQLKVMFSGSVQFFFCKYRPLWAGQSCSSLFGQQGHMGVQLNPQ